jgi:hypothetical protein
MRRSSDVCVTECKEWLKKVMVDKVQAAVSGNFNSV